MNKHNRFLRGLIIVAAGFLLGITALLLVNEKQVPAKAQAQELFLLYLETDHIRQDSAKIMAELMNVTAEPERAGATETIGSKPTLSSWDDLADRLQKNRNLIEQALNTVNEKRFTDPEVDRRDEGMRAFYTTLFEFEDLALKELSAVNNNEKPLYGMATILFEGTEWPALLAADAHLKDALASLAALHGLEFATSGYEDLFRERLVELDTPIVSDEVNTIVYPFTVSGTATYYVLLNIAFDIPLSEKITISLEDPNGRIISPDQLAVYTDSDNSAEVNHLSYVYRSESLIIVKLFPEDPFVTPIPGDWKLYITAPVGSNMVIGMIEL